MATRTHMSVASNESTVVSERLAGKITYVSAAGQGIGRAIALRLAAEGAKVLATDINDVTLAELSERGLSVTHLDGSDASAVAAFFSEIERVDALVNCIGWVHHGSILETDAAAWRRSFQLNIDPMYYAIKAVLPKMLATGEGSIVNIASAASSIKGFPNRLAYGTTKAAVIGLTKAIAADHVGQKIRCNAICPGTIATPSLEDRINAFDDPVAARAAFIARQPMGRLGSPDEVAALAAYLVSNESRFMNGSVILLDGGATN